MLVFSFPFPLDALPMREILTFAETEAVTSSVVKEYLITRLLLGNTVLSRLIAEGISPGESLRILALSDLSEVLTAATSPNPFDNYRPSVSRSLSLAEYGASLNALVEAETPAVLYDRLLDHYRAFGTGDTAKYIAFKWNGSLCGIPAPDPITLDSLFCLDRQKAELTGNTVAFLNGRPANNVLLYGNSGCGKSSTVKALLNAYYREGLRLVQINKERLEELPLLLDALKQRPFRYIVFMDDLSFEGNDEKYKALKTILEGGIETQPENVLFYATSNRFHLVNETWSDRKGEDIHIQDTQNEKLSLSDRFGIRISFLSPGQNDYLRMIEGVLLQNGIPFTPELRTEALQWAALYNGRSGRTASHFAKAVVARQGIRQS